MDAGIAVAGVRADMRRFTEMKKTITRYDWLCDRLSRLHQTFCRQLIKSSITSGRACELKFHLSHGWAFMRRRGKEEGS
jgi:hypothetical protein